jgi:hypothetical protein
MIQSQAQSVRSNRRSNRHLKRDPRSKQGVALIYAMVMMTTLIALGSLALDIGVGQIVDMQIQRAADGAAMAGAQQLPNGTAATIAAATTVATQNIVNGQPINASQVTVQLINWTSPTNYSIVTTASAANAVRVTIKQNVPLMFAKVLGFNNLVLSRSTTAELVVNSSTQAVSTNSNPWLAGEPTGTQGSEPDPAWKGQGVNHEHPWEYDIAGPQGEEDASGEPYESPIQAGIPITPGSTITLSAVSGQGNNDFTQSAQYDATGNDDGYIAEYDDEASNGIEEHGIADATMPLNSINAVFLGNGVPDSNPAPATLDFSTQAERDYTANTNNGEAVNNGQFAPKVQQVFYVGNGLTSTGEQETFIVPAGATRLFLGTMDGHEWSNNSGAFTVTLSEKHVVIVQ